jgi:hypothetical protein
MIRKSVFFEPDEKNSMIKQDKAEMDDFDMNLR